MIDILPEHLEIVKTILSEFVPDCEVRAFGSRCTGTARKHSDLDLCVCGHEKLDWKLLANLKDALMESNLPFRVDLLDYHAVPEHFREKIDNGEIIAL
ncbi:MAG: nucleotidyltransferase domain-containing protein [Planctomycetaceae bacterium]|jgi:predicted nucleotidyltransferase|nr:nucleotidyltransferase domain-containing protein [Planctomycetaceae bacterium]